MNDNYILTILICDCVQWLHFTFFITPNLKILGQVLSRAHLVIPSGVRQEFKWKVQDFKAYISGLIMEGLQHLEGF